MTLSVADSSIDLMEDGDDVAVPAATVRCFGPGEIPARIEGWRAFSAAGVDCLFQDPGWLAVLQRSLGHIPYAFEARRDGKLVGLLSLALVDSRLFGRRLVSLPRLASHSVLAGDEQIAAQLIDGAVALADKLHVRYLELRSDEPLAHPRLQRIVTDKVRMTLPIPATEAELLSQLGGKVRNQIRKSKKQSFTVHWGGELLNEFYPIYARRMAELGAPAESKRLMQVILQQWPDQASVCLVRRHGRAVAGGLVCFSPSAASIYRCGALGEFRSSAVSTFFQYAALQRALSLGCRQLDLGRVTRGSNSYIFKKRWGAIEQPSAWQHYARTGSPGELRRTSRGVSLLQSLWRKAPLPLANWLGPRISRGLP